MKKLIKILSLLLLGLILIQETKAQSAGFNTAVVYGNSTGLPFDSQIYISISAKDADVTKKGQLYVFEGEPTRAEIEAKIYNGPDKGHFFTSYRNVNPITFDMNFGYTNPLFARDKIFDKVSVSYGELGNETRPVVINRTIRNLVIPDFLWLGTRFTNIPISEGFTFNFDRRFVVMNSQYNHTKLLIYRFYNKDSHVKTVILPIGIMGNNYEKIGEGNGPIDIITILRAPPGDQSYTRLTQGKSYSKEFNWSTSKVNSKTVEESATASVGIELGPVSAGGEVTATNSKEYTKANSKGGANLIKYDLETTYTNASKSDMIVARQPYVDYILKTWVNAATSPGNNQVNFYSNTEVVLYPTRYNWTLEFTEDELLKGSDGELGAGEISKLRRRNKADEANFWEEAIRFNARIKSSAFRNEEEFNVIPLDKRFATTQSQASSFSQEVSFNSTTSLEIKGSVGIKAGPINAGGSYSKKNTVSVTTSAANGNTNIDENSTAITYHVDDNENDKIEYKVHIDPVFGTPIFELLPTSETSCPYEGGAKIKQPSILVKDPTTGDLVKFAKYSDLEVDKKVTFDLQISNLSTLDNGQFQVGFGPRNGIPRLEFPGGLIGSNEPYPLKKNESDNVKIIASNPFEDEPNQGYDKFYVTLAPTCEIDGGVDASAMDSVFLSVFYGSSDKERAPDNNVVENAWFLPSDGSLQTTYITRFGNTANITNKNATSLPSEKELNIPIGGGGEGWLAETDGKPEITNSVWFKFVANTPRMLINMKHDLNAGFKYQMAVFETSDISKPSEFKLLQAIDGGTGILIDKQTIGDTLYLLIDGKNGAQSDFVISVEALPPANNESCDAIRINVNGELNKGFSNFGAVREENSEFLIPESKDEVTGWREDEIQHPVWFSFGSPVGGEVIIDIMNATFDTQVAIYKGGSCSNIYYSQSVLIAANDDIDYNGGFNSRLTLKGLNDEKGRSRQYRVMVDGYKGAQGNFDIRIAVPTPSNDLPQNAIPLVIDAAGQGVFSNAGAFASDEEQVLAPPVVPLNKPGGWSDGGSRIFQHSVWFTFVAPSEGKVKISNCGQENFFTQLAVYKVGNVLDYSTYELLGADQESQICRFPPDNDHPNGRSERGSIIYLEGLTPGVTYYLVADGSGTSVGQFSLDLLTETISEPPANDDACDAIALPVNGEVQKGFKNFAATFDKYEYKITPPEWEDKDMGGTVWFTFVAPTSGETEISLCDLANFDTQIAVFDVEDCKIDSNFVLMGANEDGPKSCATGGDSYLALRNLTAGKKYYLVVDGYGGNRGNFGIVIKDKITPGPANDDVVNAIELPVDGEVKSGYTNSFATTRDGEQNIRPVPAANQDCTTGWCDNQVDNSVWYKFVAPADGKVNVSTCDLADFDTQLALYSATNVSDFSTFSLKAANDAGPEDCSTYFDSYLPVTGLTAGQTYYIMVDGFDGDNGAFSISLTGVADVKAPTAPTAPTAGTATETSAQVSWTAASDNVGVAEYEIFVDGKSVGKTSNTTFTITDLASSTTYSITIVAIDAAGNKSGVSTALSVTTIASADSQAPTSPTGLTAHEIRTTGIDITWTAASDNVGVKEYKVYVDGALAATVTGTTFSLSGLTAGTAYSIYVTAIDAAGNTSEASVALKVTTKTTAAVDSEPPSVPTGLVASEITDFRFLLSWSASKDNVATTAYDVYVDGAKVGSTAETNYVVRDLTKLTAYSIQLTAKDAAGNVSEKSAALKITTTEELALSAIKVYESDEYQVYPNPFNSNVYLKNPESNLKETDVSIIDSKGSIVLRPKLKNVSRGLGSLNLTVLPNGIHFLIIKTETGIVYKRLIKQ